MDKIIPQNANFFEKMTACFGDLSQFERKILQITQTIGLDLSQFQIDHLSVRMNTVGTALEWRNLLLENATLLKESEVNGRPIGLFELHQAVKFGGQFVKIVELPFPKSKIYPVEGWEHIEIVVPFLEKESVEAWIARMITTYQLDNHPSLNVKISQPEVIGEILPNPTVAISMKAETLCYNVCLKLHPYDIKSVISSETHF